MDNYFLSFSLLVFGFAILVKGADIFVDGASGLARRFGISQLVIGLTIAAMGTSLPEAAVSINGSLNGVDGIAIGNVIGSNICNILLILGVASLFADLPLQNSTLRYEIPFLLFVSGAFIYLGLTGWQLDRGDGTILWGLFLVYLLYLKYLATHEEINAAPAAAPNKTAGTVEKESGPSAEAPLSLARCAAMIVLGAIMIIGGSDLAVDSATRLAHLFGLSERLIGLTIVALGTSLPELATSAVAARKGETDIAIGNIVGSNIFNILFVAGSTAVIAPLPFAPGFIPDGIISLACVVALWLIALRRHAIGRGGGLLLLISYIAYNYSLFSHL